MRYDWTVEVDGVDVSQWVKAGGTIDYGRKDAATAFQAPVAVFEVFTKDENPNPAPSTWPTINLGDAVIIHVTHDGTTQNRRFTGKVQALDYSLYGLRVTAAGTGVDWNNAISGFTYPITGMPIPAPTIGVELETDRVQRWVGLAGHSVTIEGVPARKLRAVPANTPGQGLLDLILRIADDCDGLLLEDRLGVMHYRTLNFTRPARYTIPAHLVESTSIDLTLDKGDLYNAVTVFYGEPDTTRGGNQRSWFQADSTSIQKYGTHQTEMYTDIQFLSGAKGRAEKFLMRNQVAWQMPDVTLVMSQATGAEADAIWGLQENWYVRVAQLPDGCPIQHFDGDVLGTTEVMHETDYRLILHLAPHYQLTAEEDENWVYPDGSITGYETTGTVTDSVTGFVYRWVACRAGNWTITNGHSEPVLGECLFIAGGGSGGFGGGLYGSGGGGGAGGLLHGQVSISPGGHALVVGAGAKTGHAKGGDSTFLTYGLTGGGFGGGDGSGSPGTPSNGGDGGSGGGSYWNRATMQTMGTPGQGIVGQGTNGSGWNGGGANQTITIGGLTYTYAQGGGGDVTGAPRANSGSGGHGHWAAETWQPGADGWFCFQYRIA